MIHMTHFVLYVIVPREIAELPPDDNYGQMHLDFDGIETYIDEVMEPYSEQLDVDPYIIKTALGVKREMRKVNKQHPDFAEKMEGKGIAEAYKAWAGCELDKKGNALSTWNNKAIWDWFVIGGRWNGRLTGVGKDKEGDINATDLEENMLKVSDFLIKYDKNTDEMGCHCVIKHGKLISAGRHGWFGTFSPKNKKLTEKEVEAKWEKRFRGLFNSAKKDYVVNVDCHV